MTKSRHFGDYSPEYLLFFYGRFPGVVWPMWRLVRLIDRMPRQILATAEEFGFSYNPDHPEFTSEQAIAIVKKLYELEEHHEQRP